VDSRKEVTSEVAGLARGRAGHAAHNVTLGGSSRGLHVLAVDEPLDGGVSLASVLSGSRCSVASLATEIDHWVHDVKQLG